MHSRNTTGVQGGFQSFLFPFHNFHSEFHREFRQETLSTFSVSVLRFRSRPRSLNTFMPIPAHTYHGEKRGANQGMISTETVLPLLLSLFQPMKEEFLTTKGDQGSYISFASFSSGWSKRHQFHDATDPLHPYPQAVYHPTGRLGWATEPASAVTDTQWLPNGFKLWIRNRNRDQSWLWALLGAILRGNAETK